MLPAEVYRRIVSFTDTEALRAITSEGVAHGAAPLWGGPPRVPLTWPDPRRAGALWWEARDELRRREIDTWEPEEVIGDNIKEIEEYETSGIPYKIVFLEPELLETINQKLFYLHTIHCYFHGDQLISADDMVDNYEEMVLAESRAAVRLAARAPNLRRLRVMHVPELDSALASLVSLVDLELDFCNDPAREIDLDCAASVEHLSLAHWRPPRPIRLPARVKTIELNDTSVRFADPMPKTLQIISTRFGF